MRQEFGSRLQIIGADAGMHLVAMLDQSRVDREISMCAARENLWLSPRQLANGKGPPSGEPGRQLEAREKSAALRNRARPRAGFRWSTPIREAGCHFFHGTGDECPRS